jgi:hypothetical protein
LFRRVIRQIANRKSKIETPIAGESGDAVAMLQITTGRHEGHFCPF